MRATIAALAALVAVAAGCGGDDDLAGDSERVRLALDFQPNAAHSAIYVASERNLDERFGVDLQIRVPSASTDSLKLLTAGRADLAVVDIHDLGLARERGADIVGVAALVQRPLAAVIARPPVTRPRELEGRRVGVTGLPSDDAVLRAVVEDDGGDPDRVRRTTIGFSAVPSLVAGKVDAVVAFWNVEGVALRHRGVETTEFRVADSGAPPYPELVLATTSETLEDKRSELTKALAALTEGTDVALRNRRLAVRTIAAASGADERLTRAELDAVAPALRPPMRLDMDALDGWSEFDADVGILREPLSLRETFEPLAP